MIIISNIDINTRKIGSRLARIRKEQKLTQIELGEKINISSTHISTVENGGSYSLSTLITICDGLNVPLDYIIYGNIRNNNKDNLIDLLNICNDKEISILLSVAQTLIDNQEN